MQIFCVCNVSSLEFDSILGVGGFLVVIFFFHSTFTKLQAITLLLGLLGIEEVNEGTMTFSQFEAFKFSPYAPANVKATCLKFFFMVPCLE